MRKRRFMALLAAAVVVCGLAGCQNSVNLKQTEDTLNAGAADIKTVEPPQDGWTLEQLNDVLYMNGQKIELPLMFGTLKDGYEIRDKRYNDEESIDHDIVGGYLYYENSPIAMVTFHELESDNEILSLIFVRDIYESDQNNSEYISVNGFGLQSSIDDVSTCLGNAFIYESELFIYDIKESDYVITIPNIDDFGISFRIVNKETYFDNQDY